MSVRVLFAGHDLRFLAPLRRHLVAMGVEITEDRWLGHEVHDPQQSTALLRQADVVLAEWCVGNAVWYSRNLQPGQRLVVRLHRQENETSFPFWLDLERVERVVFVAEHIRDEACQRFGWPLDKTAIIPNTVAVDELNLPKTDSATHTLGMLGWMPERKRLDLALDVVELLRAANPRYRLLCKGKGPWEIDWLLRRRRERNFARGALRRIANSPLLRDAVAMEPYGPDVPAFLRRTGFLLSTSDSEGHQVAVLEAMAAGTVPVVLDRPGVTDQYPAQWVHADAAAAAGWIREVVASGGLPLQRRAARKFVVQRYDASAVMPLWDEALGLGVRELV